MDNRPVGVFDSGLGGLTAFKELAALLPQEDIVYFGDTGRVPYGSRSRDTIVKYARQDIAFLQSKNVKMILAACGTVSSVAGPAGEHFGDLLQVPFVGVLRPTAREAATATRNGRIGGVGHRRYHSQRLLSKGAGRHQSGSAGVRPGLPPLCPLSGGAALSSPETPSPASPWSAIWSP